MNKKDKNEDELKDENLNDSKAEVNIITDDEQSKNDNNIEEVDGDSDTQKSEIDNFEEQIAQLKDEKLRLLAEMENLRKRSDRERVDSIRYGSFNLARDILSPDDNLTRALETIPQEEKNSTTINNLIDGLKMVQKEFSTILEKHGVKKIDTLNKKFDHNFHQAMIEVENNDVEAGTVVQEMQSGYIMHDRLLRPSMVSVSKRLENSEQDSEKD
jgi:molecular chaperone GrpE